MGVSWILSSLLPSCIIPAGPWITHFIQYPLRCNIEKKKNCSLARSRATVCVECAGSPTPVGFLRRLQAPPTSPKCTRLGELRWLHCPILRVWGQWRGHEDSETSGLGNEMNNEGITNVVKCEKRVWIRNIILDSLDWSVTQLHVDEKWVRVSRLERRHPYWRYRFGSHLKLF